MAAPVLYASTDGSAPTLRGVAGDLLTLLDACLVNGYGAKAAAGWSKPYTGATNQATYRPGSGVRHYFEVDDAASGTGGARDASVVCRSAATAYGVGPAGSNATTARFWRKSNTADTTARAWQVVADDRTCWLLVNTASSTYYYMFGFGEFESALLADAYRSFVGGSTSSTASAWALGTNNAFNPSTNSTRLIRSFTQAGAELAASTYSIAGSTGWQGAFPFPNPTDGGLYIAKIPFYSTTDGLRGWVRGVYSCGHLGGSFNTGDTFDGMGDFSGRGFVFAPPTADNAVSAPGRPVFETTEWDVSV